MTLILKEIQQRKSVLLYDKKRKIKRTALKALLQAARRAPSAQNLQPWRYIVVESPPVLHRLVASAMPESNAWAKTASCLIVQITKPSIGYSGNSKDYYLFDCGLSVMSLVLEAEHQKLRCRQIAGFNEKNVKQILNIPRSWQVVVVIAIGYEGNLEKERSKLLDQWGQEAYSRINERIARSGQRKAIKEIVAYEQFNF